MQKAGRPPTRSLPPHQLAPHLAVRDVMNCVRPGHGIGIGRPDEDLHVVAEARELSREEPEVYPLTAALHVATIGYEADSKGVAHARGSGEAAATFL